MRRNPIRILLGLFSLCPTWPGGIPLNEVVLLIIISVINDILFRFDYDNIFLWSLRIWWRCFFSVYPLNLDSLQVDVLWTHYFGYKLDRYGTPDKMTFILIDKDFHSECIRNGTFGNSDHSVF